MILYRTQPRNSEQNTIVDLKTKETMMSTIRDGIPKFNGRVTKFSDITTLLTDASLVDGMLATSGYQNILVVTSFESNQYTQLRDRNYRPIKSAGDHLLPIVHSVNETHGNIYVAEPKMGSIFTPLYEKYDINIIPVDSCFKIDSTFKIKTDVKFDAVVLLGSESLQNGKFSATDVKAKFAKYCTEDFDLIDVYRGDTKTRRHAVNNGTPLPPRPTRLTGENKDIREFAEHINNSSIKLSSSDNDAFTNIMSSYSRILERVMQVY